VVSFVPTLFAARIRSPGRFQSQSGCCAGDRNLPLLVGVEPLFPIHSARSLATIVTVSVPSCDYKRFENCRLRREHNGDNLDVIHI
jgi:hypothetical protein